MNRKGERHTLRGDDIPSIQFSLPTAARVDMRRQRKLGDVQAGERGKGGEGETGEGGTRSFGIRVQIQGEDLLDRALNPFYLVDHHFPLQAVT